MLGGWLRRLRLRLMQRDEFEGIGPLNSTAEWESASPDTLAFHWLIKKPLRYVAKSIAVPDSWIANLEGNAKILWEVIDRVYLQHEKQAGRRALLEPILRYGVCLVNFDNNYSEVSNALLAGLFAERARFEFSPSQINPDNWFQDGRGRIEMVRTAPFAVISVNDREVLVDRPLSTPLITTHDRDSGALQYLALSLSAMGEPYPGLCSYPILARGASVLEVAPSLIQERAAQGEA